MDTRHENLAWNKPAKSRFAPVLSSLVNRTKILICLVSLIAAGNGPCVADPIYVYREPDGVIRFTNRPPPPGVKANIFTAQGSYSVVSWRSRHSAKLFVDRYERVIEDAAAEHQLDPNLVKAVIHAESSFNPHAVSRKGAQGLMQLMPDTGRQNGLRKPFEPSENIKAGTRHLAALLKKYEGNLGHALAAYNAGAGAVDQYKGVPPYSETQDYVRRVQSLLQRYASAGKPGLVSKNNRPS